MAETTGQVGNGLGRPDGGVRRGGLWPCAGGGRGPSPHVPAATARDLLERGGMPRRPAKTIPDPDELMALLPQIAAQGYVLDDGEQEIGVRCVAVPVPGGP